ncbi:MAG: RNB domain-containing ribonuclease [Planctomycetota bacterium]
MAGGKGKDKGGKAGGDSGKDGGEFKSFADLLRSRGAERLPTSPAARRTRVDGQEEAFGEDALDTLPGRGGRGPSRVVAAPDERLMVAGPPCYRDENSEEAACCGPLPRAHPFPRRCCARSRTCPADPRPEDGQGRADLRGRRSSRSTATTPRITTTRSPSASRRGGGGHVRIADVSHYVRPETRLDDEVLAAARVWHLADQVVPMLPEALSNGLCSLVLDRDRLAFSVHMKFDKNGSRKYGLP